MAAMTLANLELGGNDSLLTLLLIIVLIFAAIYLIRRF